MNWNDLRYALAVGRAGTLAGAAKSLGVNHSTVFRRLNALEEGLGTRLFERLPDGYVATAAGELLLDRARRVDAEIDALGRELAGRDERLSGDIRLTTAPSLAHSFVAPCLARFRERFPEVRVELAVSTENRDLSRREADLALRATSRPPEHLVGRRCVTFPWWVCAGDAWLDRHPAPASMDDLAGVPFIGPDDALTRLPAFAWSARHIPADNVTARAGDLDTMACLAIAGLGVALLPQDQQRAGLRHLFPMDPPVHTQLWLLTHPDLRRVPRIRALMDFLADALRGDGRLATGATGGKPHRA